MRRGFIIHVLVAALKKIKKIKIICIGSNDASLDQILRERQRKRDRDRV